MLESQLVAPSLRPRLVAHLAESEAEIREAQRLRYLVFAEERAARLSGDGARLDSDRFDAHCAHLLLRETDSSEVVGTYRLLDHSGARAGYGFYSETEFDLRRILHLAPWTVEIGRACIHPAYRSAAAITVLWSALMRHILLRGYHS